MIEGLRRGQREIRETTSHRAIDSNKRKRSGGSTPGVYGRRKMLRIEECGETSRLLTSQLPQVDCCPAKTEPNRREQLPLNTC